MRLEAVQLTDGRCLSQRFEPLGSKLLAWAPMTEPTHDAASLRSALKQRFGFDDFNPGQLEVIEHLMAGRSSAAVFATGAGKSLCYQLPATLLPGLTLVISPLIALMKDQIDALTARGIPARNLDSTLSFDEYKTVMGEVRDGTTRLLYVAPERFNNERFREALRGVRVSLFAVDEAHCMSEWGHNFRTDYLKLAAFAEDFGAERVLALTATATEPVLQDICRVLNIAPQCAIRTAFYRKNLTLLATPVSAAARDAELIARFQERPPGPAIVYVTLQKTAEQVAALLQGQGIEAKAYHAGMGGEARAAIQDWFIGAERGVVVATIAFGMGIDKSNIRYVYHYNLPKSLENYSQEIGRAGRDGERSICEILACEADLVVLENFVYGDTPTLSAVTRLTDSLFSGEEEIELSLTTASSEYDIRVLVLRTLLTYLELRGHLAGGTPLYSLYEFKPLMPSGEMIARFDPGEQAFVRKILSHSQKARVWFKADADQIASSMGVERHRVVGVLDSLAERQMIELRAKGVRHRYFVKDVPDDKHALAAELHQQAVDREKQELGRLAEVVSLITRDGCQVAALGAHFAETLDGDCGHCSWCASKQATPFAGGGGGGAKLDDAIWQQALELRREQTELFSEPRTLAQFLCGIPSPAISRARLGKHTLFGAQSRVPFSEVMRAASGTA